MFYNGFIFPWTLNFLNTYEKNLNSLLINFYDLPLFFNSVTAITY